ncbi:unnamed protein product [Brassica oleracea var. botrytis]|uniref:Uncharacterized protein n=1 Tax=Brassica oleracea TaxID=3712 RepID=A0A3P6DI68_BRAOL|nr:unnamed protein product [Brassica oleracea]
MTKRFTTSLSADGSLEYLTCTARNTPLLSTPLLRLAWNKQNLRCMATILMDSNEVVILDIRWPTMPVAEL